MSKNSTSIFSQFELPEMDKHMLKATQKRSISANMLRIGSPAMRRDIAEMLARIDHLKSCAAAMVQRARDRTENVLSIIAALQNQVQQDAVADVGAASELWKRVDDTQRRWVAKYDWDNYEDARRANMLRKKVPLEPDEEITPLSVPAAPVKTVPPLKRRIESPSSAPPLKIKRKIELTSCSRRTMRALTRSSKSLALRERASSNLTDKLGEAIVPHATGKTRAQVPTSKELCWMQKELHLNKCHSTRYHSQMQVQLNIADVLEGRGLQMPTSQKSRAAKVLRWVKKLENDADFREVGRPKNSTAETTNDGLTAVDNYTETTGFAPQVYVLYVYV